MSYEIPEQPIYLYDPATKKSYYFDGVLKIEHSIQLKIEDDPSNIKDAKQYTNNAKNEPDEIKLEIVMSNVYSSGGNLPGTSGDRLKNAYSVLDTLKKNCTLLNVVTELKTYTRMLIKQLAVTQAEGSADSWSGTITLHEVIEQKKKTEVRSSSTVDDGLSNDNSSSLAGVLEAASANRGILQGVIGQIQKLQPIDKR